MPSTQECFYYIEKENELNVFLGSVWEDIRGLYEGIYSAIQHSIHNIVADGNNLRVTIDRLRLCWDYQR